MTTLKSLNIVSAITALTLLFSLEAAQAAPTAAPPSSASCVACHGAAGISINDLWPNLAGQKKDYLAIQLRAFKSGTRVNPLMNAIAQTLKDSDIDELAQYFSNLQSANAKGEQ